MTDAFLSFTYPKTITAILLKNMQNNSHKVEEEFISLADKLSSSEFKSTNLTVYSSQNRIVLDRNEKVLQPKVMQLLLFLCAAEGKTITKEQLNNLLWPDTQVGPDSLANTMTRLRRALGDNSKQPEFIETVQRKGYRWLQPIEQNESSNTHKGPQFLVLATVLAFVIGISYWLAQPDIETFPFTDLSIQTTDEGMEVKVGIEGEFDLENQEKVKQ